MGLGGRPGWLGRDISFSGVCEALLHIYFNIWFYLNALPLPFFLDMPTVFNKHAYSKAGILLSLISL